MHASTLSFRLGEVTSAAASPMSLVPIVCSGISSINDGAGVVSYDILERQGAALGRLCLIADFE